MLRLRVRVVKYCEIFKWRTIWLIYSKEWMQKYSGCQVEERVGGVDECSWGREFVIQSSEGPKISVADEERVDEKFSRERIFCGERKKLSVTGFWVQTMWSQCSIFLYIAVVEHQVGFYHLILGLANPTWPIQKLLSPCRFPVLQKTNVNLILTTDQIHVKVYGTDSH